MRTIKDDGIQENGNIESQSNEATSNLDDIIKSFNKGKTIDGDSDILDANDSRGNTSDPGTTIDRNSTANPDPNNWRGDSRFYQTGGRAGQLRLNGPKKYTGQPVVNQPPVQDNSITIDSSLINGAIIIMFIDFLLPEFFCFLYNLKKDRKIKLNAEDLALEEKQIKKLEPLADKVIDQLKLRMNPLFLMGVTFFGIYMMNFAKATRKTRSEETVNPKS